MQNQSAKRSSRHTQISDKRWRGNSYDVVKFTIFENDKMIKIKIAAKKHVNSLDLGWGISYNAIRSAILENEKTMKIDAKSNR